MSYDAAGDMTADTVNSYTYDAENRINTATVSSTVYCFTYDADGIRTAKFPRNGSSCTTSPSSAVLYWRNIAGNTIAETDASGAVNNSSYHEYVFFAGRRIARADWGSSSFTVYYYFVDHLGSTRSMTSAAGSVCFKADYLPYGAENTPSGFTDTCSTTYKFTGYERDTETGLDYAFARYYNQRLGRFMSGDPLSGDIGDPQSLNRYAYVGNNPINSIDPTGMQNGDPQPYPYDPPACGYDLSCPGGGDGGDDDGPPHCYDFGGPMNACRAARCAYYGTCSQTPSRDPRIGTQKKPPQTIVGDPKDCSLKARIFQATDFSFKEGIELETGILNVGVSRNVNFETNASTVQVEFSVLGAGASAQKVTDTGYLAPDSVDRSPEFSGHLGPIEANSRTGQISLSGSKLIKLGFAIGGGFDVSFDWNKFKELTDSCK